jgi:anti-sigma regulatory factor (Ser/Thr protein kinase)
MSQWEMSDPEQVSAVHRLLTDHDAPRAARDAAADVLDRLGCGDHRGEDLALAVSELVTNAVVHGPGGEIELCFTATTAMIRVEVCDAGATAFEWPDEAGDGHWGLGLVRIFSDRAGIDRVPTTVVWCEFDLANSSGR